MSQETIKITTEDKFIWKVVTAAQALAIMREDIFPLYALFENETESMVCDQEELKQYIKDGVELGVEVGFVNYKEEQQLRDLIICHDFYFEMANGLPYRRGKIERENIMELSKSVKRSDFVKWWNRSAPISLAKTV
jgi:hypothetical protein